MRTLIKNGKIILPNRIVENKSVIINGNKIEAVIDDAKIGTDADYVIDAKGLYVSPGFVDIHVHGGGGYSFMDGDTESFLGVARAHAIHGTTSLLPTTLACTFEELKAALDAFDDAVKANKDGANMLGFNLEGPYFSLAQCGAQNPEYITPPQEKQYKEIAEKYNSILMWCSAPELEGAPEFARYLTEKGIVASIAHTNADYDDVVKGYEAGYRHVTHIYSGMTGVFRVNSYRHAGVVESAFLIDDLTVEVIADGCHLPKALLQLIYKIKGADRIALVTDATNAAGQNVTESILGSRKNGTRVIVEDGVAKLPDRQSFAGSVATTDRLVRNMYKLAEVKLVDAVRMASLTPARIIKKDINKGSIAAGKDADIVLFDDDINIKRTIIGGKTVFMNE